MAGGKIILFGKTGSGKSTIANVLVTGGIDEEVFPVSDSLRGCTRSITTESGNGWTVTDTVGLGESKDGTVDDEKAKKIILDFLKGTKGNYSHIIYVKSAGRFDILDDQIWKVFRRVFKGAEDAFTIIFTRADKDWITKYWSTFPEWVKSLNKSNVIATSIPPVEEELPAQEKENKRVRAESIPKLEADLNRSFEKRNYTYATPDFVKLTDDDLEKEAVSVYEFIKEFIRSVIGKVSRLTDGLGEVGSVIVRAIRMFS